MEALKVICVIAFFLVCIGLIVVVMLQDAKSEGLSGAISGGSGSYYSKNKGRTKEGMLNKLTLVLAILFIILSIVLNFSVMK